LRAIPRCGTVPRLRAMPWFGVLLRLRAILRCGTVLRLRVRLWFGVLLNLE